MKAALALVAIWILLAGLLALATFNAFTHLDI